MGQRGERAVGISTAGFLFGGKELREVVTCGLLPPVVGEQPHPVPGGADCTRRRQRRSNLARLVSPHGFDTEAVVVEAGVKSLERRCPSPRIPARMATPLRFRVRSETRPCGRQARTMPLTVSSKEGRYMATP